MYVFTVATGSTALDVVTFIWTASNFWQKIEIAAAAGAGGVGDTMSGGLTDWLAWSITAAQGIMTFEVLKAQCDQKYNVGFWTF